MFIVNVVVAPFVTGENPLQCYNMALCLKSLQVREGYVKGGGGEGGYTCLICSGLCTYLPVEVKYTVLQQNTSSCKHTIHI